MNHAPRSEEREVRGEIMKTDVFVKIFATGPDQTTDALRADLDACFAIFRDFEARYSRFLPESELSRFNRLTDYPASEEFFNLLSTARDYWSVTDGVFNPTIISALEQSGYGPDATQESTEKIAIEKTILPLSALQLDAETHSIHKPLALRIDLGGIGKGYCVDQVAHFLESQGYENFLVDAGGDMYASGTNLDTHSPWMIELENPLQTDHSLLAVSLQDQSVATSGRNRRHWLQGQTPHHHLIHPTTGESRESHLVTVTVISTTASDADVWAKTLFLLGEKDGILKAEAQHIPACFAFEDGTFQTNSYFQTYVSRS